MGRALAFASLRQFDDAEAVMSGVYDRIPPGTQPDIDGDFIHIWLQLNQPHRAWTLLECWLKEAPEWAVHSFLEVMEFVLNAVGLQATYDMYRKAIVSYGALLKHLPKYRPVRQWRALSTIRMHSWNC